jgi:hypothetical protein
MGTDAPAAESLPTRISFAAAGTAAPLWFCHLQTRFYERVSIEQRPYILLLHFDTQI